MHPRSCMAYIRATLEGVTLIGCDIWYSRTVAVIGSDIDKLRSTVLDYTCDQYEGLSGSSIASRDEWCATVKAASKTGHFD